MQFPFPLPLLFNGHPRKFVLSKTQNSGQAGSVVLVITSCLCFIQSSTTFIVLMPLLYKHKCAITFLKMQFSTAVATLSGYVSSFYHLCCSDLPRLLLTWLLKYSLATTSSLARSSCFGEVEQKK